jgi:hypothetical protein
MQHSKRFADISNVTQAGVAFFIMPDSSILLEYIELKGETAVAPSTGDATSGLRRPVAVGMKTAIKP